MTRSVVRTRACDTVATVVVQPHSAKRVTLTRVARRVARRVPCAGHATLTSLRRKLFGKHLYRLSYP